MLATEFNVYHPEAWMDGQARVVARLNGYQVCRLLRDHQSTAGIPVILLPTRPPVQDSATATLTFCMSFMASLYTLYALSELNLTAANLLGASRSKLTGRHFAQFVASGDRAGGGPARLRPLHSPGGKPEES